MPYKFISAVLLSIVTSLTFAQKENCVIKNYLSQDGTMYYYAPADTFYYTKEKMLLGGMATDKENYLLALQPFPKPASVGKLRDYQPLTVTLSNDSTFTLDFYDARFVNDTAYIVIYLFDVKKNRAFLNSNVESMHIQTPFIDETFKFKLHKDAIIEHLKCLNSIKRIQ